MEGGGIDVGGTINISMEEIDWVICVGRGGEGGWVGGRECGMGVGGSGGGVGD